jgi:uncharacterized membrane protein
MTQWNRELTAFIAILAIPILVLGYFRFGVYDLPIWQQFLAIAVLVGVITLYIWARSLMPFRRR